MRKAAAPYLSIVIPCFNEAVSIVQTVETVIVYLKNHFSAQGFELILVNDGSKDQTLTILKNLAEQYAQVKIVDLVYNWGRGKAVRSGIQASRGAYVICLDADLSYDVDHIAEIMKCFQTEPRTDVVVVSAYMKGGVVRNVPFHRYFISKVANKILAGVFPGNISTITCVVRGYRGELIRSLPVFENGKELHLEILRKVALINANIVEIPGRLIWKKKNKLVKRRKTNLQFTGSAKNHFFYAFLVKPTRFIETLAALLIGISLVELISLASRFFHEFESASGEFSFRVWHALAETMAASPHTVVIAAIAIVLSFQSIFFLILLQMMKLQQEEVMKHMIASYREKQEPTTLQPATSQESQIPVQ